MDKETVEKFLKDLQKLLKKYKVKIQPVMEAKLNILPDDDAK